MSSLDSLIESYYSEAGFDSSGRLTLDRRDQARKLAERWGVTKLNCLLFGVQAAHAVGCSRLDLKLQPESWELTFPIREELGGATRFLERILGDEAAIDLDLFRRLYLAALSCGQEVQWIENGDELMLRIDFRRASIIALLRQKLLGEELRDLRKSLRERCCLALVPVYLNGKLVNSGKPEDCSVLGLNISYLSLQPEYWENGPWVVEKFQLTDNQDPESFILANRAIRDSEGCMLNGTFCNLPESVHELHDPRKSGRRGGHLSSCLTLIEGAPSAQVESCEWLPDRYYNKFDESKDLLHSKLKLNEQFILGTRTRMMGTRNTPVKFHDLVIFANGLANSLSPVSLPLQGRGPSVCGLPVPSMCAKYWLGLRGSAPPTSWLIYVKHGVLLDPVSLEMPFPTSAIRADNSIRTDYSGLRVVTNDQVRSDIDWVRQSSEQLLHPLANYRKLRRGIWGHAFTPAFQDSMLRALKYPPPLRGRGD